MTSTSPYYSAGTVAFSFPGQTATINLGEVGFGGTFTAVDGGTCANVATFTTPAAGATSSTTLTAGTNNSVTCTITFGDGSVIFAVTVTTGYTSSTLTVPTIAGIFDEYTVPTANAQPYGITTGPDGALWFSESAGNKIARVTTGEAFSEFPITAGAGPGYIVIGPDGAFWFTELTGNKIGRMTLAGALTEFTIPTTLSIPVGITAGPDGALWFTENNTNKIGRLTTAGAFTEYAIPTSSTTPLGFTIGPDGAFWFSQPGTNQIGHLHLPRVTTSAPPQARCDTRPASSP